VGLEGRDEVTVERKSLRNEKLDLYPSPNNIRASKSRRMIWTGHVAVCGRRGMHTEFWRGNLRKITPFLRPRRRWEGNIKMDIQME
jgi:hypothetical protein